MQLTKMVSEHGLKAEYGLRGIRTFPWQDVVAPFGSGYCVVDPGTETLRHVNSPADEEELFVGCSGTGVVLLGDERITIGAGDQIYIPVGVEHSIVNETEEEFAFFTIWWNSECVDEYNKTHTE